MQAQAGDVYKGTLQTDFVFDISSVDVKLLIENKVKGYSLDSDLEGRGLEDLSPAPVGIPFKNGSVVNAFVATGFEMGIFEVDVKGVIELLGEGDRMNQVNTTFRTSGKVLDMNLTTAIEIGLASYRDVIYRELASVTTIGIDF